MAGTKTLEDIQLIIEDIGGGGGRNLPPGDGGGDDENKRPQRGPVSPRRYFTALSLAMVSILMFFMALASAYVVRKGSGGDWVPFYFPQILWANTIILLGSSAAVEVARRRLAKGDARAFGKWWVVATALGLAFLAGQLVAWRQLVAHGFFMASNPASSFFYIFTGAHAAHLLGGVGALLYVLLGRFENRKLTRQTAAQVTAYFWHFLDVLWIFLLALFVAGK